jgi:hypothetical protein
LAAAQGSDRLGDPIALTDGFSAAFLGAGAIAVVGAAAAAALLRSAPTPPVATAPGETAATESAKGGS